MKSFAVVASMGLATFANTFAGPSHTEQKDLVNRQYEDEPLCASQSYSAKYEDLSAPSLALLTEACRLACDGARSNADNYISQADCVYENFKDVTMQSFHLIRWTRCIARCTEANVFEGDCGCTIDAKNVWVIDATELKEACDAKAVIPNVFKVGWSSRLSTEDPAAPCPSPESGPHQ